MLPVDFILPASQEKYTPHYMTKNKMVPGERGGLEETGRLIV